MLNQRSQQTAYLQRLLDALLLCLAFALAFELRQRGHLPLLGPYPLDFASHFWLLAIAVPLYWALTRRGLATAGGAARVLRDVAVPFVYLGLLLGTAIFLFQAKTFSRAVFFAFLLIGFVLVSTVRAAGRLRAPVARAVPDSRRNLLIIGLNPEALGFRAKLESRPEYGISVVGHLAGPGEPLDTPGALGGLERLERILEERVVDDVVFVVPPADLLACERAVACCEEVGVNVHLKVDFVRTLVAQTYPTELDGTPLLTLSSTPRDPGALLLKRGIDVAVSASALLVLSPLLLLTALAIKLTSPGKVIFSQERLGLNGRAFRLLKFRSMVEGAERRRAEVERLNETAGPTFKSPHDPRVTPLGRWLRKFSIDELPQLWNVLLGDMSLVGPRPPLASEVRQYQRWQRRRLSMQPGLTCLWQIRGRNRIPFEEWMKLDLEYIDNWSLSLDVKILLRTVPAILLARGAH